jgi:hypothetical protein
MKVDEDCTPEIRCKIVSYFMCSEKGVTAKRPASGPWHDFCKKKVIGLFLVLKEESSNHNDEPPGA